MTAEPLPISVTDVSHSFGRHRVLQGVTFTARRGEAVGIVGENGAGKTTLLRIMAGLLPASHGHIAIAGYNDADRRRP